MHIGSGARLTRAQARPPYIMQRRTALRGFAPQFFFLARAGVSRDSGASDAKSENVWIRCELIQPAALRKVRHSAGL